MKVYRITSMPPHPPRAGVVVVDCPTRPGAPYAFSDEPLEDRPSWETGGHD